MDNNSIGRRIQSYRKSLKISQEKLAEAIHMSTSYISALERGARTPSLYTFIDIANTLNVSADMLLEDLVDKSYQVKASLLSEKLEELSQGERQRIFTVIETLIK